jgi:glycosyltransferase involved in cell wall biosynthesis
VVTEEDITDRTPAARAAVLEQLKTLKHGQAFLPPSLEGTVCAPGFHGGATWSGASFDPTSTRLYVNSNDVPSILKAIDLFVMPSHMEGLGTSVLDAMAARAPVVGTEAGGMPESILDGVTGLVCPIKDSDSLAKAILRMLSEPELAASCVAAARAKVEAEFSTRSMVEGTLKVYRQLLGLEANR